MGSIQIEGSLQMQITSPLPESSCAYLLQELKMIWDEVGQDEMERQRIMKELEEECVEVYKRKVDRANMARAKLHQALAESEAELTNLLLSLGERSFPTRREKLTGSLKEQLDSITPALQEMQMRKEARVSQFTEVQTEIQNIASEIAGKSDNNTEIVVVNEGDLSLKKLEEYQSELERLKREKSDRLRKVEEYKNSVYELAVIMGMEPSKLITEVHPSLLDISSAGEKSKNISDSILSKLKDTVKGLKEEKNVRMDKIKGLEKSLTNLWNILDTKFEERQKFSYIKLFSTSASTVVVTLSPGTLTLDKIQQVEIEVKRLDQLKSSKMKELFWKKRVEIDEICKKSHMELPSQAEMDDIITLINSGRMEHDELLKTMEEYIERAKEESFSRREIMDKVEKWIASSDEERWLEEYSQDEKRYSVSRGAHKNLRRAERARVIVNKIPGLVEQLMAKAKMWEEERKKTFFYDQLPLLAMLEEYVQIRKEKEEEKYRQRERKKIQNQLNKAQISSFSSRTIVSTSRPPSSRGLNISYGSLSLSNNKRISTNNNNTNTLRAYVQKMPGNKRISNIPKDDKVSEISTTYSVPSSP